MIKPLPHPYCQDSDDASTLSSSLSCPIMRVVLAMILGSARPQILAP
jgi:hypothetical protein